MQVSVNDPDTTQSPLSAAEFAAWGGFLRVHATLVRALDAELRAAHQLPLTEFEVLLWLSHRPEHRMRMAELADSVLLSLSGMSRLVERLERRGYVQRETSPEDRRGAYAVLTQEGLALVREARGTHWAGIRERFLRHFTDEELEGLAIYWSRLLGEETLGERTVPAGA